MDTKAVSDIGRHPRRNPGAPGETSIWLTAANFQEQVRDDTKKILQASTMTPRSGNAQPKGTMANCTREEQNGAKSGNGSRAHAIKSLKFLGVPTEVGTSNGLNQLIAQTALYAIIDAKWLFPTVTNVAHRL
jgi:hypothetical protein